MEREKQVTVSTEIIKSLKVIVSECTNISRLAFSMDETPGQKWFKLYTDGEVELIEETAKELIDRFRKKYSVVE